MIAQAIHWVQVSHSGTGNEGIKKCQYVMSWINGETSAVNRHALTENWSQPWLPTESYCRDSV